MNESSGAASTISLAFATRAAIVSRLTRAAAVADTAASSKATACPSRPTGMRDPSPAGTSCHTTSMGGRSYPASEYPRSLGRCTNTAQDASHSQNSRSLCG